MRSVWWFLHNRESLSFCYRLGTWCGQLGVFCKKYEILNFFVSLVLSAVSLAISAKNRNFKFFISLVLGAVSFVISAKKDNLFVLYRLST